jgi:hypothetical protein
MFEPLQPWIDYFFLFFVFFVSFFAPCRDAAITPPLLLSEFAGLSVYQLVCLPAYYTSDNTPIEAD